MLSILSLVFSELALHPKHPPSYRYQNFDCEKDTTVLFNLKSLVSELASTHPNIKTLIVKRDIHITVLYFNLRPNLFVLSSRCAPLLRACITPFRFGER